MHHVCCTYMYKVKYRKSPLVHSKHLCVRVTLLFRSFHSRARDESVQQVCAVVKRVMTALLSPPTTRAGFWEGILSMDTTRPFMFHATQLTVNRTMFRSFHSRARDESVQQVCAVVKRVMTALLSPKHSRKFSSTANFSKTSLASQAFRKKFPPRC